MTPIKQPDKSNDMFVDQLEDWESKNHRILIWCTNTIVPSINVHFGHFELAKEAWDFLATRYNSTTLSHQNHLMITLSQLRRETCQSIDEFHSKMQHMWDMPEYSESNFKHDQDIFLNYQNQI